ncbi:MAG: 5'-nucleotidase, partial [Ramlibacter sp.]
MATSLDNKLVVAISSRALFNLEEENQVYESGDPQEYMRLQLERMDLPAGPGIAFSLIKKLLAFNDTTTQHVEVVILSRNDPVSGMRIFRSGLANEITLQRGVFTQGRSPFRYLRPLGAHLFLSANAEDVREALAAGFPAARVLTESVLAGNNYPNEVRIAFDGDAVLFSDEAERVFQDQGLDAFQRHEQSKAAQPLPEGPFKPLLAALHRLQQAGTPAMRIRTAL